MPGFSPSSSVTSARLKHTASKVYRRMRQLGLSETELSERCSLAATTHIHGNGAPSPNLARDRVSKILMNRRHSPAKSAAKIVTHAELKTLAHVLGVSVEWLVGQEENQDPVVWNVLASVDRVSTYAHLLQEHEQLSEQTIVWSRYPIYAFMSEALAHAFNQIHYGRKPGVATKPVVEFYNRIARTRRKWLLRPHRSFSYSSLVYKSDFEAVACGQGAYSAISKTTLRNNMNELLEIITNSALKIRLVILCDETEAKHQLHDYEALGTSDSLLSVWNYHNGDIGWSEHPAYVKPHRQLLERLMYQALHPDLTQTVEFIKSLRDRLS